jgi:hypothetical protein
MVVLGMIIIVLVCVVDIVVVLGRFPGTRCPASRVKTGICCMICIYVNSVTQETTIETVDYGQRGPARICTAIAGF